MPADDGSVQELQKRLEALDPDASHALRIIAAFDELVVGGVGTRGLLSAAASMAGCTAGFRQDQPAVCKRVAASGALLDPTPALKASVAIDGQAVWLEREGPAEEHDSLILTRLALALRIRHGRGRAELLERRDMAVLLDPDLPPGVRRAAASRLGVRLERRHRVVVAPLFARWASHPVAPEDVVPTAHGPLHVLVVPEGGEAAGAVPSGTSAPTSVDDLPRALLAAVTALRLWDPDCGGTSRAEHYGGLVDLLVDLPDDAARSDVDRLEPVAALPWGAATLDALVQAVSVRHAARLAYVHHSTMHQRLQDVVAALGYDPLVGYGRARLGVAWLRWRLRHSTVLTAPGPGQDRSSACLPVPRSAV